MGGNQDGAGASAGKPSQSSGGVESASESVPKERAADKRMVREHGTPVSTHLLWYLEGGQLELSTSRVERSIKLFVIEYKNFLFANTRLDAQASAVIFSLIGTAKETGLDRFHYLTWVLETAPILDHTLEG